MRHGTKTLGDDWVAGSRADDDGGLDPHASAMQDAGPTENHK